MKRAIKKVVYSIIPPPVKVVVERYSYSQAGEDAVINFLINDKKITSFTYLDIGTSCPDKGNNTYLFYRRGQRGVCVEADPERIPQIKEIRKEDIVINVGVNIVENNKSSADFYIFDEPSLNTFDKEEAISRENYGTYKIRKVVEIKIKSLNEIISENFKEYPEYLSIDIEGLDFKVLKSLDLKKYPIPIICAETCTYSENHIRPKNNSIIDFMSNNGYMVYADTYVNTIFVNKNWFFQK